MARRCKRLVLKRSFESDLDRSTETLHALLCCGPPRDWTLSQVRRALFEYVAALPVYRTYVTGDGAASPADAAFINEAVRIASQRKGIELDLLRALADVFLSAPQSPGTEAADLRRRFVTQLQQMTGAVMAKGCEDTAFYRYLRLTALVRPCIDCPLHQLTWYSTVLSVAYLLPISLLQSFIIRPHSPRCLANCLSERGRRRSRSVRHVARGVPQVQHAPRRPLARRSLIDVHARH